MLSWQIETAGTPPVIVVSIDNRGRAFIGDRRVRISLLPGWMQEFARNIRARNVQTK